MNSTILCGLLASLIVVPAYAQETAWHQATGSELAAVLPSRAQVENEHIETEMRTASGIVNDRGQFFAGVVLLTAGYSADGKYSHYLLVQAPVRVAGFDLPPGDYLLGSTRADSGNELNVHFNVAATGKQVGIAEAKRIPGRGPVESVRIWPPQSGGLIQIGRFGIPYKLGKAATEK
jgi:hypothetical protein